MSEKTDKSNSLDIKNPELEAKKQQEEKERVEREEQERTTKAKQAFLEVFAQTMGIITATCQKTGINRSTYYDWLHNDPEFKAAVDLVNDRLIDYSEDKLKQKIVGGNLKAVLFHLSRISPKYRQKIENFVKDQRTLEDLFDEAEAERQKQQAEQKPEEIKPEEEIKKDVEEPKQNSSDASSVEDQRQEGQHDQPKP